MKKILIAIIALIIIAVAAFAYATRPAAAPTSDIDSISAKLPAGSDASVAVYKISQEKSLATFEMNELLSGKPKLVVGTTTQIAGDIIVREGKIEFGELRLNARTLVTDNERRNGAINNLILKTGEATNEYVVFVPRSTTLSETVQEGKSVTFDVTGDLTISGVTKPATFKVNATVTNDTITGTAETRIKRSDFNIVIPNLAFLANIDNEFPVRLDIVAERILR